MKKYRYKILPEKHLIIKYFRGSFTISEIIKWMDETAQDSLFDTSFNVLNDYRDAESKMSYEEIHKFIEFLKGDEMSYGKRKSAFITDTPNQTVFSFLLYRFNNEELIKIRTFSTLLDATKWLGLQLSEKDSIENFINDLKKENLAQTI
jgi:hypothetical protein